MNSTVIKSNKKELNGMLSGSILKNVLIFAIPIIIGNILQQTYTTVDTVIVSLYCSGTALAAVGTSAQPIEVLLCIFLGIGAGASIIVSQSKGAGDFNRVISISKTATSFVYYCGIPLTILGIWATPLILKFMDVPGDVWDEALLYTRIVLIGTIGNIGYNMNAGLLRGIGDSVASLCFLFVSAFTNIVFDIIFVAKLGYGVKGAALATCIALILSWLVSVIYIKIKYPELEFTFLPGYFNSNDMEKILRIGLPIGLNNSLYALGHMALQTMVNAQGSAFIAGCTIGGRLSGLSNITIMSISSAASTFSGQNYGAKKYERLKEGYIKLPFVSGIITLLFGITVILIRTPILEALSQNDNMVFMYAERFVMALFLSQWMFAIFNCLSNIVTGVGLVKYTTIVNLLMLWAVRIPCAYLIARIYSGEYVMMAYPVSFLFAMVCMIGYCSFSKSWKRVISGHEL